MQYKRIIKYYFKVFLLLSFISIGLSSCSFLKNNKKSEEDPRIKDFNFNYYFLEGNKQKFLGDLEKALEQYSLAYQVDNTNATVCYEIAGLLNLGGDYSGAVEYAEKAVSLDDTENIYYKLLLAYVYENNQQLEKASNVYKNLIKQEPPKINYYFELSDLYIGLKKYKDAIKTLENAENKFGVNEIISLRKEACYYKAGQKDEAIKEIKKLSEAFPNDTKYKTLLGETYVNTGQIQKAEEVFNTINPNNVTDGIVFFSIADFYRTQKNYDKTFEYINLGINYDDVELDVKVRMLLQLLEASKNNDKMISNINNILEKLKNKYPSELKVRALIADTYIFTQKYKLAQKEFDFILSKDKSKYQIWEQALRVDFMIKDMQTMYNRSKEAKELYPNVIEIYRYLVISAYAVEKYSELTEYVDYISPFLTNDEQLLIEFLSMQGDAFHKLNMHHESDSVYEMVLDRDAENLSILNNYSYFLAERNQKLNRALELSTKLIELKKDNPTFLDTHAWVLYKNKKYKDALKYISDAVKIENNNQVFLEHKGDILLKLNKINEAIKCWEKSIEYGNNTDKIKTKIQNAKNLN